MQAVYLFSNIRGLVNLVIIIINDDDNDDSLCLDLFFVSIGQLLEHCSLVCPAHVLSCWIV